MFISKTIKTEIVTVTPEIAGILLARNTRNRRISKPNYLRVKEAMAKGEWEFNGEAIKIAADGTILDGQHRLFVSSEIGVSFKTIIVYGLPPETQDTMDTGKARTIADVLTLHQVPSATRVAAIVSAIIRTERHGLRAALSQGGSAYPVTSKQVLARIEQEPELLELPRFIRDVGKLFGGSATPATLYYTFSKINAEDAEDFFGRLGTGQDLSAGDAILALRNLLQALKSDRGEKSQRYVAAVAIKAWNKYRDGEQVGTLRFSLGGANPERFPEPR